MFSCALLVSTGEVVSGYAIHNGEWREIGRVSPQLPEMFYDVSNPDMTIENGDVMVSVYDKITGSYMESVVTKYQS